MLRVSFFGLMGTQGSPHTALHSTLGTSDVGKSDDFTNVIPHILKHCRLQHTRQYPVKDLSDYQVAPLVTSYNHKGGKEKIKKGNSELTDPKSLIYTRLCMDCAKSTILTLREKSGKFTEIILFCRAKTFAKIKVPQNK